MYVIQASPLTKIFLPEWEARCTQDPGLIMSAVPFSVTIPRSAGAIILEHNVPVHVSKLIRYNGKRKVEYDEVRPLVQWLTDEMSGEADIYGVVAIDLEGAVSASIQSMIGDPRLMSNSAEERDEALKEQLNQQQRIVEHMKQEINAARERANARVKKQLKMTHHNLMKQWENNHAEGKGGYPPSATEALGAFILSEEIKAASQAKQAMIQNLNNLMQQTRVG